MPVLDTQALIDNRVNAIADYHEESGIYRAEIDVSGGVDSATMLILLARALDPHGDGCVTAVYSSASSSLDSLTRAKEAATVAGVKLVELDLTDLIRDLEDVIDDALRVAGYDLDEIMKRYNDDPTIIGSLRSCIRAPIGRYVNRLTGGGIRHGTGNECEDRWLRFYQKGGDGEVDCNALAALSKGEVYQLARALGVPRSIMEAVPSPDLWGVGEKHTDEEELTQLSGGVEWTYSRINLNTGEYRKVGTIERMSRFLDLDIWHENRLFGSNEGFGPDEDIVNQLVEPAVAFGLTREHLVSARHWERITRHKRNRDCPTLTDSYLRGGGSSGRGARQRMLEDGILTNDLPEV